MRTIVLFCFFYLITSSIFCQNPSINDCHINLETDSLGNKLVGLYEKIELSIDLSAQFTNPFDYEDINLFATFISPSNKTYRVDGFYYEDYDATCLDKTLLFKPDGSKSLQTISTLISNDPEIISELSIQRSIVAEVLKSKGFSWKIRFAPTEIGDWTFIVYCKDKLGTDSLSQSDFRFKCTNSSNPGFVRTSNFYQATDPGNNKHGLYLQFDNGYPFFGVGQNMAFYFNSGGSTFKNGIHPYFGGTCEYKQYIDDLRNKGNGNFIRVYTDSYWALSLEQRDFNQLKYLGDYTQFLEDAWQLDWIIEHCYNGHKDSTTNANSIIYLELVLLQPTSLSGYWGLNPYNRKFNMVNGQCNHPLDFFAPVTANNQARNYFKRRLRYIMARWGYASNILSFELYNEIEQIFSGNTNITEFSSFPWKDTSDFAIEVRSNIKSWSQDISSYMKSIDINKHLITFDFCDLPLHTEHLTNGYAGEILAFNSIDYSTYHRYYWGDPEHLQNPTGDYQPNSLPEASSSLTKEFIKTNKPTYAEEFGFYPWFRDFYYDPHGFQLQHALWSSAFSGSFMCSAVWDWAGYIDAKDLYHHYKGIRTFMKDIDLLNQQFEPYYADEKQVICYSLIGKTELYGYILNSQYRWNNLHQYHRPYLKTLDPLFRPSAVKSLKLEIPVKSAGLYDIHFYHCNSGEKINSIKIKSQKSSKNKYKNECILIPNLSFDQEIAFKIYYLGYGDGECSEKDKVSLINYLDSDNQQLLCFNKCNNQSGAFRIDDLSVSGKTNNWINHKANKFDRFLDDHDLFFTANVSLSNQGDEIVLVDRSLDNRKQPLFAQAIVINPNDNNGPVLKTFRTSSIENPNINNKLSLEYTKVFMGDIDANIIEELVIINTSKKSNEIAIIAIDLIDDHVKSQIYFKQLPSSMYHFFDETDLVFIADYDGDDKNELILINTDGNSNNPVIAVLDLSQKNTSVVKTISNQVLDVNTFFSNQNTTVLMGNVNAVAGEEIVFFNPNHKASDILCVFDIHTETTLLKKNSNDFSNPNLEPWLGKCDRIFLADIDGKLEIGPLKKKELVLVNFDAEPDNYGSIYIMDLTDGQKIKTLNIDQPVFSNFLSGNDRMLFGEVMNQSYYLTEEPYDLMILLNAQAADKNAILVFDLNKNAIVNRFPNENEKTDTNFQLGFKGWLSETRSYRYCAFDGPFPAAVKPEFEVYPNPTYNGFNIFYKIPENVNSSIAVYNSIGSLVYTEVLDAQINFTQISQQDLKIPGTYFCILRVEGKKSAMQKIIVIE